jgi:P-type Ca2+ transporter type 2C
MTNKNWHSLTVTKIFELLKTTDQGLAEKEAENRWKKYGENELAKQESISKITILLNQFRNSLVIILLVASYISLFLSDLIDAYVILAAVLLNVIIGFFQENKAQQELSLLKKYIVSYSRVIRSGQEKLIETKKLVPGDIISLAPGDKVPADARLIIANELEIDEASLTGESMPIAKNSEVLPPGLALAERLNYLYQGTIVLKGKAKAVVTATGKFTEFGQIADSLNVISEEKTPLQKKLIAFSQQITILFVGACLIIFMMGVVLGQPILIMFNTAIAVAVSAIPEGLLVSVTVILAIGMQVILKKNALVTKLVSAETLGSTTVICTDKTGTLTKGEMQVVQIVALNEKYPLATKVLKNKLLAAREVILALKIGILCNEAIIENENELKDWKIYGSATDRALLLSGMQAGLIKSELEKETPIIDELPFDSDKKAMATLRSFNDQENIVYVKGAPEILLKNVSFVESGQERLKVKISDKQKIAEDFEKMSNRGLRVIAVAYAVVPKKIKKIKDYYPDGVIKDLAWVGLIGLKDPLREEAKATIDQATAAGLKVVILTGDNRITARSIAEELGIKITQENILDVQDLLKIDDEQLKNRVKEIKIYSRVTPLDKLRIIRAWAAWGEVVAMTGDGVNDAPALKQASIGIALGSGTEVAKETADIILLDNNFSTIIAAVKQGRIIYDNIKKVVLYLFSDSFSEIFIIFGAFMLNLPLPFIPAQILWINLIADSLPNFALTVEPGEPEIMKEKPESLAKPILDKDRWALILIISIVTAIASLITFYVILDITGNLPLARTMVFTIVALDSLLYVFSCRSLRNSIFSRQFFSNVYLIGAVLISVIFQVIAIYWPPLQKVLKTESLNLTHWFLIIMVCLTVILLIEIIKIIFFRNKNLINKLTKNKYAKV